MITLNSKIKDIVAIPEKAAIIEEYIPDFRNRLEYNLIKNFKAEYLIGKGKLIGLTAEQEREMADRLLDL